jgi:hypothetical protein
LPLYADCHPLKGPDREVTVGRRQGKTMTMAAVAAYAYDQIDQARAELNAVSK